MNNIIKIGLGGGCHWCTEAVFQSLIGVSKVEQGWIASDNQNDTFSEAVIVSFNADIINLETLIEIHLHTHKSTSNHSMRKKYRSAIYYFDSNQKVIYNSIINKLQLDFNNAIITKVLLYKAFKASRKEITNYYYSNPKKPFCERFISPKLLLLMQKFSNYTDSKKLNVLISV